MPKRLKDHFIFEKQFLLNMLAIAVPIALQNMISFGVAMMDSVMLGGLGDKAISAANLGGQPFSLLMSIGFGLSSGGSVLIAQYWGRGDVARIRTVMRLSMQIVFTASSLMTLVCLLFPQQVMGLYSNEAEIVAAAAQYLQLVALSYLPYSISNNYIMSLRAVERHELFCQRLFQLCLYLRRIRCTCFGCARRGGRNHFGTVQRAFAGDDLYVCKRGYHRLSFFGLLSLKK